MFYIKRVTTREDQHIQLRIQTDPTQRASIREDQHIQLRIQTDLTQRASIREDQHIQLRTQTDPTQRASIREDQHIQLRILTDPTQRTSIREDQTYNRGGYRQTLLRGLPSDQTTTKPQEIKTYRHYIKEEPAVADQRVSNSLAKYINKGEIL